MLIDVFFFQNKLASCVSLGDLLAIENHYGTFLNFIFFVSFLGLGIIWLTFAWKASFTPQVVPFHNESLYADTLSQSKDLGSWKCWV